MYQIAKVQIKGSKDHSNGFIAKVQEFKQQEVQISKVQMIGEHSNGIGNPKQMRDPKKVAKVHINGSKFTSVKNVFKKTCLEIKKQIINLTKIDLRSQLHERRI